MLNADHQKQRCHNEDDYRLKKNARNRKYYKNKCEKAAMDSGNTWLSDTSVNTLVIED
jgi:hypothetical protein